MSLRAALCAAGTSALLVAAGGSTAPLRTSQVFSVAADGSGRVTLTNSPGLNGSPAVSADGKQVAFVSTREGFQEIYVMNADGSSQERVCPRPSLPAGPCVLEGSGQAEIGDLHWSPKGAALGFRVVFPGTALCYSPGDGDYVLDLTDGQVGEIAYGLLGPPLFSADGRFVGLTLGGCQDYPPHVAVMGAGLHARATGYFAAWAPHHQRLLYERGHRLYQGAYPALYLATMDPAGHHRWTLSRIPETAPSWSPNGRQIAFFREDGSREGLYIVRVGRHAARRVLRSHVGVSLSAWSPNGAWIAFGGARGTYFVRSNGKGLRSVAGAALLALPSPLLWSSDSRHFAFVDDRGVVRVVSPPGRTAVAVTSSSGDHDVCRVVIDLQACQLAWAGDRLLFAAD